MKKVAYKNKKGFTRYKYERVCECGDVKWVSYLPPEGTMCIRCAGKVHGKRLSEVNIKSETDKKVYTRTCIDCADVRTDLKAPPREPQLCATCSRKRTGKANVVADEFAPTRMLVKMDNGYVRTMYLRTCYNKECGESAYVSFKPKVKQLCQSCARRVSHSMVGKIVKRPNGNKPRTKPNKPRKSRAGAKPRQTSPEAIEKVREVNRAHKEAVAVAKVIPQTLSDEDMIAKFLKGHKVTVIPTGNDYSGYSSGSLGASAFH